MGSWALGAKDSGEVPLGTTLIPGFVAVCSNFYASNLSISTFYADPPTPWSLALRSLPGFGPNRHELE